MTHLGGQLKEALLHVAGQSLQLGLRFTASTLFLLLPMNGSLSARQWSASSSPDCLHKLHSCHLTAQSPVAFCIADPSQCRETYWDIIQ